jgi:hypothetical protein
MDTPQQEVIVDYLKLSHGSKLRRNILEKDKAKPIQVLQPGQQGLIILVNR